MFKMSYEIHTNNELKLMLEGRKPLAIFSDEVSCLPNEHIIPENAFAPYVESGQMVRQEETLEGPYSDLLGRTTLIKQVLFSLVDEQWRITVMLQLQRQLYKTGEWNETCEGIQGFLLGYTEEEQEEWRHRHSNK